MARHPDAHGRRRRDEHVRCRLLHPSGSLDNPNGRCHRRIVPVMHSTIDVCRRAAPARRCAVSQPGVGVTDGADEPGNHRPLLPPSTCWQPHGRCATPPVRLHGGRTLSRMPASLPIPIVARPARPTGDCRPLPTPMLVVTFAVTLPRRSSRILPPNPESRCGGTAARPHATATAPRTNPAPCRRGEHRRPGWGAVPARCREPPVLDPARRARLPGRVGGGAPAAGPEAGRAGRRPPPAGPDRHRAKLRARGAGRGQVGVEIIAPPRAAAEGAA